MSERNLADVTCGDWAAHEGTDFALALADGSTVALTLLSAESRSGAQPFRPGGRAPFALLFRAASRTLHLPQQIYGLEHPTFGRWEIFLVPIGPDEVGMRFEAHFS